MLSLPAVQGQAYKHFEAMRGVGAEDIEQCVLTCLFRAVGFARLFGGVFGRFWGRRAGFRRGELLGLRWCDYDPGAATITVAGSVGREKGKGLQRRDKAKTDSSLRTVILPRFAVEMLNQRRARVNAGEREVIFPSSTGTLRDPNGFDKAWRKVRDELGLPEVTGHSFRKTVLTMIDEEGMSARVGADQAGHTRVSMTQDKYMARGRTHPQVADLLDRAISDE